MKEFIESIIELLNSNSGAITVLLVILTGFYVYLTWRLLKANNKPEIAIRLRPHRVHVNWTMLSIENIGTGPARDVQFETDLSFKPDGETPLEEFGALREGIRYFPRGTKIHYFLVSAIGKLDELKQTPLQIAVTYKDPTKLRRRKENFCLDFGELEGSSREESPLFEIAKAIQDVKRVLHDLTTGVSKPTILTEPLSKHLIREYASTLEKKLAHLPDEAQQEIVQEVVTLITKKEQEVQTGEANKKTIMEYLGAESQGLDNIEKEFAIADKMTRSAAADSTDGPDSSE